LEWAGDNRRYEGNYLFMNMIEGEGITWRWADVLSYEN
jgi:hypothetical protein